MGPLASEGGLCLKICAGIPPVPSYAAADRSVCQDRFTGVPRGGLGGSNLH